MTAPFKDSSEANRRIAQSMPMGAAVAGVVGLAATEALTKVGVWSIVGIIQLINRFFRAVFATPRAPYEFGSFVMPTIALFGFIQAYFMWGGRLMITPVMMFLVISSGFVTYLMSKEIEDLSKIHPSYTENLQAGIAYQTLIIFGLVGGLVWMMPAMREYIISFGVLKSTATQVTNIGVAALSFFILVILNRWSIAFMVKARIEEMANELRASCVGNEQATMDLNKKAALLLREIDIVHRENAGGFPSYLLVIAISAAYAGVAWFFGRFDIVNYSWGIFS